ncbi:hypothetical protein HG531_004917 [Fusarium graminearum]|nr:hypothetical protein HG531_004917 [Fusarium graminearum]
MPRCSGYTVLVGLFVGGYHLSGIGSLESNLGQSSGDLLHPHVVLLLIRVERACGRTTLLAKLNGVALKLALATGLTVVSSKGVVSAGSGGRVQSNGLLDGLELAVKVTLGDVLLVLCLGRLSGAEDTATTVVLLVGEALGLVGGLRVVVTPSVQHVTAEGVKIDEPAQALELVHGPDDVLGLGLRVGPGAVEDLTRGDDNASVESLADFGGSVCGLAILEPLARLASVQEIRKPVDDIVWATALTGVRTTDDEELGVLSNLGAHCLETLVGLVGRVDKLDLLELLGQTLKRRVDLSGCQDGLEVAVRGGQTLGNDLALVEAVACADGEVWLRTGLSG